MAASARGVTRLNWLPLVFGPEAVPFDSPRESWRRMVLVNGSSPTLRLSVRTAPSALRAPGPCQDSTLVYFFITPLSDRLVSAHGVRPVPAAPLQHWRVHTTASCRERDRCAMSCRGPPRSGSPAHRPRQHKPVMVAAVSRPPTRPRQASPPHLSLSCPGSPRSSREPGRPTTEEVSTWHSDPSTD